MARRIPVRELFLIDGNSLVYRAFFALPETIATSRGVPTNAIFGFASMLVKLHDRVRPEAHDRGLGRRHVRAQGGVRRTTRPGRASRPDLLREQWPHMEPLVDAFGYTNVRADGYEADDVIATLAGRARRARAST